MEVALPHILSRRDALRTGLSVAPSAGLLLGAAGVAAAQGQPVSQSGIPVVHYRTTTISGVDIFYQDAGPKAAPALLLLHGFPTSSHMYRKLIPLLADRYRVIAPDYPGFGHSGMPDRKSFSYTFAHFAELIDALMEQLQLRSYGVYLMDYGAPVGFRIALKHPDRIRALIIQNGNAYDEGLEGFWDPFRAYWKDHSEANRAALAGLLTLGTTKFQYTDGVKDTTRIDPDNWLHDQTLLDRPGNKEIQLDLFLDYGSNVALYPQFQDYLRAHKPPTIIAWGANDKIFPASGARAYLRDLPSAEFHLIDTGHFALEDKLDEMEPLIRGFLKRQMRA
jgi:pimeloyl-ACP methyl ester carboxylesterase